MSTPTTSNDDCRLGVLAFGDSITNGGGELQWGVALQSWALWVARALGLPFTSYAADGATAEDVVSRQIPAFKRHSACPQARYDLGCLYIGVNDVRSSAWEASRYRRRFSEAIAFLGTRCARVLTLTAPVDLGRPRAGAKVKELNTAIEEVAREKEALVADLRDFGARNHVMTDHVHPTAFGQVAIAERALAVLARDGMPMRTAPASMISYRTTWWQRLRGDVTYAYRHAKVSVNSVAVAARVRLLGPPSLGSAPSPASS